MKSHYLFSLLVQFSIDYDGTIPTKSGCLYRRQIQKLEGFSGKPVKANAKKAGVLILPAWMGVDAHSKESATELSKLGYYTFVADIYGIDKRPKNTEEAGKIAGHFKTNYKEYQHRIQLALETTD